MNHEHGSPLKHMFMMAICCAVPLALLVLLPILGISLTGGLGPIIVLVLCPAVMGVMMWMMPGHGHRGRPAPAQPESTLTQNPFSPTDTEQVEGPALEGGMVPYEPS